MSFGQNDSEAQDLASVQREFVVMQDRGVRNYAIARMWIWME